MTECSISRDQISGARPDIQIIAINFRVLNSFLSNSTWELIILIFDIEPEVKESHVQKKPSSLSSWAQGKETL